MSFTPWYAGQTITAGRLNGITPTWQAYTPTWTTSDGLNTPAIGNGSFNCSYAIFGNTCTLAFEVIFGSTTTFPSGATNNWRFGLPVPAAGLITSIGRAELLQSNPIRAGARMRLTTTGAFELEIDTGRVDGTAITATGIVDASAPWAWASGNAIRGNALYEIG
jgi:hypothetical protein